jgi:hypothetical protein
LADIILKTAVAGLKTAHLPKITSAFEFSVLTLTVPGLRLRKIQNPLCFWASAPFSSSLTAVFRIIPELILNSPVAGLKMAHLLKITLGF